MTIPRNLSFLAQGASASGVLSVPYGGTGNVTLTAGYIPYGNGTSAFNSSANLFYGSTGLGVGNNVLTSNGGNVLGAGSNIQFAANAALDAYGMAKIQGYLVGNGGTGDYGHLDFYTKASGSVALALSTRMFGSGGVSIGNTTDPGAGNLRFNTTGTNGIYFGSSSILTDYEEGTWTPTLSSYFGTITTVGSCVGVYRKIGKQVFLAIDCAITVNGTGAGLILIGNLPYAGSGATTSYYSASGEERTTATSLSVEYQVSSSRLAVYTYNGLYPGGNLTRFIISLNYPT